MSDQIRILIFASGNGSNAEALIRKAQASSFVQVAGVVTNNSQAQVIQRASDLKVASFIIDQKIFPDQKLQEQEMLRIAKTHQVDWIFLAGYMKLLSKNFIQSFLKNRIVNIHPSLLPQYPGTKSIERAYQDQVEFSGVTLHYVDEGMDTGKIIRQEKVPCRGLSMEEFSAKMHQQEHEMYTEFLEILDRGVST